MRRRARAVLVSAFAGAMFCVPPSFAHPLAVASPVASVSFSDTGEYRVHCLGTRWTLEGKLGDKPGTIKSRSGSDRLGAWREVEARTRVEIAAIRVYENEPVVPMPARARRSW